MDIHVKKTISGLKPLYDSDYEKYKRLKLNEDYLVTIKKPRNYKFHKKFFSLLNLMFANQDNFDNFDVFREEMIIRTGHWIDYKTDKGFKRCAQSISFAKMDNFEFEELYSKMIDQAIKITGAEKEDIINEIINYM